MNIITEQRFITKPDGSRYLQVKYIRNISTVIHKEEADISDWEDVPLCEDEFPDAENGRGNEE